MNPYTLIVIIVIIGSFTVAGASLALEAGFNRNIVDGRMNQFLIGLLLWVLVLAGSTLIVNGFAASVALTLGWL